ncbi:DUF1048 domain-containing protein [Clostridium sp. 'White wine YQ']|uniref:DUF1048 domain-containing protein n=1 Tax=Clostridium sp. 'White wine YQ' TaxID=3027474 RepID=UPI00236640BA|nr:DUF1048 domain-containing protein [Clostridium sp. 'White wine YQ']MDD7793588.1 DUF1048 domain-containing protein [Clostridium sp. 'White wine YQ']
MKSDKNNISDIDNYKDYINQLENEYKIQFNKVEAYINISSKLKYQEKNSCLLQVMDSFLSAQEVGKNVLEITGDNLKSYCDNMIYGESIYIYKVSRICSTLLSSVYFVAFVHLFISFCNRIFNRENTSIFSEMRFGLGEIVLMLGIIISPILTDLITKKFFENPKLCKRIGNLVSFLMILIPITVYTFINETFDIYGVIITFNNSILILLYLTLINFVVWSITRITNNEKLESRKEKYIEFLSKDYNKYINKCNNKNRNPLDWNSYLIKKKKQNSIYTKLYLIYGIIFLILSLLIGKAMIEAGKLDFLGIIFITFISLLFVIMFGVVMEGINRNKMFSEFE